MSFPKRTIQLHRHHIDVVYFGYASFYYPQIGDQEFPVTQRGYRAMSSWLRTLNWIDRTMPGRPYMNLNLLQQLFGR
jgi:hypothetical protein